MKRFRIPLAVGVLAFLPAAAAPAAGAGSAGAARRLEDAVITAKVKTAIVLNRQLDSFRINVETEAGVVTLKGMVRGGPQRELAEEIARSVEGVGEVVNRLRIDRAGEEPPPAADRTFTQKVRDATITASVRSALLLRKGIQADRIRVRTRWGVVTLEGTVASEAERELVLAVVGDIREVREVRDLLDRIPDRPGEGAREPGGDALPDFLIASQVHQALALSRRVDGTAVRVRSEGGVVTLAGRVATGGERAEAVRIAAAVWGVGEVVDRLEVGSGP